MSFSTWTPDALLSNARHDSGSGWRVVEAQHFVSTTKLTDSAEEQRRLEELIEDSKPVIPEECRYLHYLLFTPFRYGAPYPYGSRFRAAGLSLGVFYGAVLPQTAIAEVAFHRLLFYAESPATPWPSEPGEFSVFSVEYATGRALDLTLAPLSAAADVWTHPTDYAPCQQLAERARTAGVDLIKYQSARDPDRGLNLAILSCRAFTKHEPVSRQSWRIQLSAGGVRAVCEFPRMFLDFDREAFARDPRMSTMTWDR